MWTIYNRRLSDSVSLSLLITLSGRAIISNLYLLYIMEVLEGTSELEMYLEAFDNIFVSMELESFKLDNAPYPSDGPPNIAPATPPPVANLLALTRQLTKRGRPSIQSERPCNCQPGHQ